jgi:hypothetical protein
MSGRLASLAALAAAVVCTIGTASATALPRDGKITADCVGFTVTFYGSNFDPGDFATVGYHITLTNSSGSFPYVGSQTMNYGDSVDPLWSTDPSRPSKAITVPWGRDVCGQNSIVSGGADPDGMYFDGFRVGAFAFNWSERYPSYADDSGAVPAVISADLLCECPPTADEICRTPGFWGTHAGAEKTNSQNITQAVLDAVGGVTVCGQPIFTTVLETRTSAVEGMCVSPKGDQKLQLARQLTAAALNCVMSGGGAGCTGVSIQAKFATCNDVCSGISSAMTVGDCIAAIDCFNNGGSPMSNGGCSMGTCNGDGVTQCEDDDSCTHMNSVGSTATCVPNLGNCHDRALVNQSLGLDFDPPGPAGSSGSCNSARKNKCNIFGGDGC